MENTIPKWLIGLCLLALLAGTYFRFTQPLDRVPTDDEVIVMVAAAKLNTNHSEYDPRYYNFEHPFLGKKILGEWIGINSPTLTETSAIPVNLFAYNYLAAEELREWEWSMRIINAIFGLLMLIPLFLIAQKWFGARTGIMSIIIFSLSIGYINLSRYLIQDGILPFFYLFTIYFFLLYVDNPSGEWRGIRKKNFYLIATIAMWVLALLIRIHQPLILGIAMLIALAWIKHPIKKMIIMSFIGLGIAAIAYTPTAILVMIRIKGANAVIKNSGLLAANVISGMISQNSIMVIGLIIMAIIALYLHREKWLQWIKLFVQRRTTNSVEVAACWITLIPLIFSFFTSMGTIPRYFLLAFVFPMIYLGKIAAHASMDKQKYAIVGLVVADIVILALAAPSLMNYSVAGMQPTFLIDETSHQLRVIPMLASLHVDRFFTNDAGLLFRNPRAAPLPPYSKWFAYHDLCNENFRQRFHKSVIVYRSNDSFYESPFVCPFVKIAARPISTDIIPALPPYKFYMVIDENQLTLAGT
jgi:hypothetical protein